MRHAALANGPQTETSREMTWNAGVIGAGCLVGGGLPAACGNLPRLRLDRSWSLRTGICVDTQPGHRGAQQTAGAHRDRSQGSARWRRWQQLESGVPDGAVLQQSSKLLQTTPLSLIQPLPRQSDPDSQLVLQCWNTPSGPTARKCLALGQSWSSLPIVAANPKGSGAQDAKCGV